jgi:mRNA-degrading endonuclease RelE of RelBE toxin-antitoxin system
MRVEFLEKFSKDIDKISLKSVKQSVEKLILLVEATESLSDIPHLKKTYWF